MIEDNKLQINLISFSSSGKVVVFKSLADHVGCPFNNNNHCNFSFSKNTLTKAVFMLLLVLKLTFVTLRS